MMNGTRVERIGRAWIAGLSGVVLAAAIFGGASAAERSGEQTATGHEHTWFSSDSWLESDYTGEFRCLHGKLEHADRSERLAGLAWDKETGEDLRHYPPDPRVDYLHMKLDMHFADLNEQRFRATETLRFSPIAQPLETLKLNAVDLIIHDVRRSGESVEYFYDDDHLTIHFDPALPVGEKQELVIEYECVEPWDGMTFTPSSPDAPAYTAEVHTQGQTEFNRHWFVAHDFPNEQLTTELIVNVPKGYQVSGNGRLVSHEIKGDREIWHWLQDKPHVNYLVSLVIGKFDIVELPHDRVKLEVWVPEGEAHKVEQTYGQTARMIDVFEKRFGVKYPWDRYAQLVVKNFGAGGMENTTATNMYPTAIFDETALREGDLDGLIAHELAHQWAGDYITCRSWEHIWLNEGWATYGSALWFEQRDGQQGYLDSMRRSFRVARRDNTDNLLPMVSPIYEYAFQTFRRRANPYPKGSSILHMLRMMLGEQVFWKGVHQYFNQFGLDVAETEDFRYVMEEVSGRNLQWFFDQWCYRPGTPDLHVDVQYDGDSRQLNLKLEQKQHIDARTPAFRFTLPVFVQTRNGAQTHEIDMRTQSTEFTISLDAPPEVVAVDPYLHVLKTMTVNKPMNLWRHQAEHGPTIAARHEAISALGDEDTPQHVVMLERIVRDESIRHTLRQSAVGSLNNYGSDKAKTVLMQLAQDRMDDPRVRRSVVRSISDIDDDSVVDLLAEFVKNDPSYDVKSAAIGGLADHDAEQYADLIVEMVHFDSQHQNVRVAALRALAELDDPRGLDLAIEYSAYGHTDRARARTVRIIGDLADHNREHAVDVLLDLLHDPENRTVRAAGGVLAEIGARRAIDPISAIADTHPDPGMRERAKNWIEEIQNSNENNNRG